jgi:hypothetical protein
MNQTYKPVASLILLKSSYSNTSPLAITGIDSADTTSAISSHLAGSFGLSLIVLHFLKANHETNYL